MESTLPSLTTLHGPLAGEEHLRLPPANDEAEQALLGAILANNAAYEKVADFLRPEHFADGVHARIFEACGKLIERGQIANAIQLKNLFEQESALAEVGGAQYLAQLQSSYVTIINAIDYGKTIHDLYLRRQLIDLGEDMVNDAFDYECRDSSTADLKAVGPPSVSPISASL